MSQRSRLSRYSRKGHSVGSRKNNLSTLEKIPEGQELLPLENKIEKWNVWDNDLTKEEAVFNSQITSYKQDKERNNNTDEEIENQDKISELGKNIIDHSLKKAENSDEKVPFNQPILWARCMYDLYMSKGIIPQTKQAFLEGDKIRSHSETRSDKELTNEEMERKIQKEMVMAKHLGSASSTISSKPGLMQAAQTTIGGLNFKPSMSKKQNQLASNFSELTGSTSFIEKNKFTKTKAIMDVSVPKKIKFSSQNYCLKER